MEHTLFPGGKRHCITLSYDDGNQADRRMAALLNRYGFRCTFCLNSGTVGTPGFVTAEELRELYRGHEVACHTVHHPDLTELSEQQRAAEVLEDRKRLEGWTGHRVTGFSYPYGGYNDDTVETLRRCGILYARTVEATGGFGLPEDLLRWHPTCRHREGLEERTREFLALAQEPDTRLLFFLWGHSYEFDRDGSWDLLERFCRRLGGREDTWYATNGQAAAWLGGQTGVKTLAVKG